jgi:hypothetical protein
MKRSAKNNIYFCRNYQMESSRVRFEVFANIDKSGTSFKVNIFSLTAVLSVGA